MRRSVFLALSFVVTAWGLNVVMVKYLVGIFPPLALSATRIALAALFLVPLVWWREGLPRLSRRTWGMIAAAGTSSIFLHQIFLSVGLVHSSAAHGALILGLNPLATSLLAAWFLGERLTRQRLAGIAIGFLGVALLVTDGDLRRIGDIQWGDALMFGAMLTYVIGTLLVRVATREASVLVVSAYSHLLAAVQLGVTALIVDEHPLPPAIGWWPIAVLFASAWVSTALGALLWNWAVRHIGAASTAMWLNGLPATSLVFSALLLDEALHWLHGIALACIVAGVSLGVRGNNGQHPVATPHRGVTKNTPARYRTP